MRHLFPSVVLRFLDPGLLQSLALNLFQTSERFDIGLWLVFVA